MNTLLYVLKQRGGNVQVNKVNMSFIAKASWTINLHEYAAFTAKSRAVPER
jgi:hypothetical protein